MSIQTIIEEYIGVSSNSSEHAVLYACEFLTFIVVFDAVADIIRVIARSFVKL